MPNVKILNGSDSFRELIESGSYYVDKTDFIEEFFAFGYDQTSLITRPRRFGKSLIMSMLDEFFNIEKDSRHLFAGLKIAKNQELCAEWMNNYPVLSISFHGIEEKTFPEFLENFKILLQNICLENEVLRENTDGSDPIKQRIQSYYTKTSDLAELKNALLTFCLVLAKHYQKPVILLLDEYDVPLATAWKNNYYEEMISFLRTLFVQALKSNKYLKFAVLTGCLRIAKESIFTGLNNFTCYGIDQAQFADKYGFTNEDVDLLLKSIRAEDKKSLLQSWYDGYQFGTSSEIYCPWDVLQYVKALQKNHNALPEPYWINTSSNAIVSEFLTKADLTVKRKWESLIRGGSISVAIQQALTFDTLFLSEDHLWSTLYLTGYLTKAKKQNLSEETKEFLQEQRCELAIPNTEIQRIFTFATDLWFTALVSEMDRNDFFRSFWDADEVLFARHIEHFLQKSISYYDSQFDFCHGFMNGIFFKSGYVVTSNYEHGEGRPDIVVEDSSNRRVGIIEVKHTTDEKTFSGLAQTALKQIETRHYDMPFQDENIQSIVHVGIAFYKKYCRTKCFRIQRKHN